MNRLTTCAATLIAAFVLTVSAADILSQLGLKPQQAKDALLFSVTTKVVSYDLVRVTFKSASADARATLVKGALEWARVTVDTPEFAAAYAKYRDEHKPQPPKPASQEVTEGQAQQRKAIEDLKKQLPTLAPEMRKTMEETIKALEAQIAAQQDPALQATMRSAVSRAEAEQQKQFAATVAEYDKKYPPDVHKLVAMRLQEFLDASADVDFGAALVDQKGTKTFADPKYESKPAEWKLCYRAGKPAVDAARTFATGWLAALKKTPS